MSDNLKSVSSLVLLAVFALASAGCAEGKKTPASASTTGDEAAATAPAAETAAVPEKKDDGLTLEVVSTSPEEPSAEAKPAEETKSAEQTAEAEPAESKPAEQAPAAKSNKVMLGSPELTAGIPGEGPLKIEEIESWLNDPKNHEVLDFELPLGLAAGAGQVQGVDKNPLTRAKIELGRQLYFDPRLSADMQISCASCHDPDEGYAKHTQFGVGIKAQTGGRNSPVSYNRILSGPQFWDGRAESLEAQAIGPIANPIEMGSTHDACVECLKAIPGYKLQVEKIFGKFDIDAIAQALASFERTIVTAPTPFDYYEQLRPFEQLDPDDIKDDPELSAKYEEALAGAKAHPLSESAKRGRDLYFSDKASCSACHVGPNLSDEKYHNIGVGMDKEKPDIGRKEITGDDKDTGAFKTPTIRNVATSAPYMHDGSQKTLEEVVEWYAKGGHPNPHLSEKIKKLDLSEQDKKDLVEFMRQGCSSEFPKVARGRLPE